MATVVQNYLDDEILARKMQNEEDRRGVNIYYAQAYAAQAAHDTKSDTTVKSAAEGEGSAEGSAKNTQPTTKSVKRRGGKKNRAKRNSAAKGVEAQ